jgi:integrase
MAKLAGYTGLRVSEVVGLRWQDLNFSELTLQVNQSVVHAHTEDPKTAASGDIIPLPAEVARDLLEHRKTVVPTQSGWVFPNPKTLRPYHQEMIQKRHIRPALESLGLEGRMGWHTLRHSFRNWLDQTGAPVGAQKDLMRHADIRTTLNIYGGTITPEKRRHSDKLVELIRRSTQE